MIRRLLAVLLAIATLVQVGRAEQCLVIGDSLTKEYQSEFPALFPANPASWSARNWIEILHIRRSAWFDTGRWSGYVDPRVIGHEHNWAFPGATTTEIKTQLDSIANFWWKAELNDQLKNAVERVVIFAGGNDVDSYYRTIYNASYTGSQTAATFTNQTRDNIKWIVNYVRSQKSSLPIVLVPVPHIGCAPDVQNQCPTDPVKTGRVTAALDVLNAELAAFAASKNIGFAAEVYDLTKQMIDRPFVIGGISFYKEGDMDARPRYLFSGDGFHPNTCAHGKIAQIIIQAFRTKYPGKVIPLLPDSEIITEVLGLDPNIPYNEWIAADPEVPEELRNPTDDPDADGIPNLLEFALSGMSPGTADIAKLPTPARIGSGSTGKLVLTYTPNSLFLDSGGQLISQASPDLLTWTNLPAENITTTTNGTHTATIPFTSATRFLRLKAVK